MIKYNIYFDKDKSLSIGRKYVIDAIVILTDSGYDISKVDTRGDTIYANDISKLDFDGLVDFDDKLDKVVYKKDLTSALDYLYIADKYLDKFVNILVFSGYYITAIVRRNK